jgi:hypothetical protein
MAIYLIVSIIICAISFLKFRGNLIVSTVFVILFGVIIYLNERKELRLIIKK